MDDVLYLATLKYLGYRPRSEKEIRDYLKKKIAKIADPILLQNAETIISTLIAKLKSQKFLNDEEFAQMWARSRMEFGQKGRQLIKMELQQKGISPEIIEKVLSKQGEEIKSDLENAIIFLEKKKKKFASMGWQERYNKVGHMLARRGFDLDTIRKSIDSVFGK